MGAFGLITSQIDTAPKQKRGLGPARVVFNPRYRHDASDEKLIAEVRKRMAQHRVAKVLFVKDDGSILRLSD